jgi:lipopolysaccharide biosynthesis regulator YciM
LDHAERILKGILEGAGISEPRRRAARSLLLDVYQQERNWQSAIDVATALDETTPAGKRRHAAEIAHFWCELAAEAIANGDAASAQQRLAHALAANAQCVRANVLKAEWAAKSAQHRQVVDAIHAIEAQDARYLGLVAELFLHANAALGRDAEGLSAIREMHAANPSLDLFNVIFKATLVRNGAAAAAEIAKEDLRANPTLVGLDRLMEAELPEPSDAGRAEAERRRNVVHSHASRLAVYLCGSCGFKAKQWYWHCPACNGWETFPPRRTAEYDTAERHLARLTAEHIDNRKGTA